jgi:hypothetical protein
MIILIPCKSVRTFIVPWNLKKINQSEGWTKETSQQHFLTATEGNTVAYIWFLAQKNLKDNHIHYFLKTLICKTQSTSVVISIHMIDQHQYPLFNSFPIIKNKNSILERPHLRMVYLQNQ